MHGKGAHDSAGGVVKVLLRTICTELGMKFRNAKAVVKFLNDFHTGPSTNFFIVTLKTKLETHDHKITIIAKVIQMIETIEDKVKLLTNQLTELNSERDQFIGIEEGAVEENKEDDEKGSEDDDKEGNEGEMQVVNEDVENQSDEQTTNTVKETYLKNSIALATTQIANINKKVKLQTDYSPQMVAGSFYYEITEAAITANDFQSGKTVNGTQHKYIIFKMSIINSET